MKKQWIAIFLCLSLLATGLLGLTGCAAKVQAEDLMKAAAACLSSYGG